MNILNFFSNKKSDDKGGSGKDPNNNNHNNSSSKSKLKYESQTTGEVDSLNNFIKDFKFDKMVFKDYEDYLRILNFLMGKRNQTEKKIYKSELDYLYEKKLKSLNKEVKQNESNINKMKELGKIYTSKQTFFDPNTVGQNALLLSNNLKAESLNSFVSIMANNCVTSGKWCYEVTLLSNGLMQIGFCQLITPFSRHGGVGDDLTSFAYDGYRKMKWNKDRKEYGKIWDIGDVVGCCIDMDKKIIEYFLNGQPLGIAFNSIPKGENIAFFPGISFSRGESVIFNFGQLPFKYEYKNYNKFDTPMSKINGIDVVISDLLKLWRNNILPLVYDSKISDYQNLLLSSNIFDLISQYITDPYIFHEVILPFLLDIIKIKEEALKNISQEEQQKAIQKIINIFISSILNNFNTHETQKNVGYYIFEQISVSILEKSLRMGHYCNQSIINEEKFSKMINTYELLMKLFIYLLKYDIITKLLFEKGTLEVFKNVFNCNWFHMGDLMDHLFNKYNKNIYQSSMPVNKIIKELRKEVFNPKEKYYNRINETVSKHISELTYLFLTDKRIIYDNKILKDKFNDLIKNGYSMIDGNEVMLNILGLGNKLTKQEPIFLRNLFMNLIYMFDSKFLNMDFDKISTSPWFNRMESNAIYYDEVGIGGTISHVTSEYINLIEKELIVKNDDFSYDFFHKLIHMCNDLFINSSLKKFDDFYAKSKISPISFYMKIDENGTSKFNSEFRKYFYIYPTTVQIALYKMAFFILKYLRYLVKKNPYIIYFIPTSVTEIPFSFFKLLLNLKSSILYDRNTRLVINKCSKHFANDDFVQNIVEFYLILFADEKIANPELKESLLKKVNLLLEKQILEEYFEDNDKIFESLIKGLLKDIKGDILSHSASRILLKLISPICFGYKYFSKNSRIQKKKYLYNAIKNTPTNQINDNKKEGNKSSNNVNIYKYKDESLIEKIKKYFQGNFKILEEFIKSYGIILNKVMTNYSMSLSSIIEIGVSKLDLNNINANRHLMYNHGQPQSDRALYQGLSASYNEMCQLLKIYEFLLLIYPDEFLDTAKLNYLNFINVLKNISTRVINKPYILHIQQLIEFINPKINSKLISEKNKIELSQIGLSIAGIFIQIYKWKTTNKHYNNFCKKTANTPDLNIEPYRDFMKLVINELNESKNANVKPNEIINEIKTNYNDIINYLLSLRTIKDLTNDEMDKLISEDKLCILCYENPSDVELIPCRHKCCQNCYNQYKIDKDICFICQQKIESVNIDKPK